MGSFTPCGAACCVTGSCWGTFTSVLIIPSPTWLMLKLTAQSFLLGPPGQNRRLDNRHQFCRLLCGGFRRFRLFPHMRNLDALQYRLNAFIHLAQGLADVAPVALTTLPANGDT